MGNTITNYLYYGLTERGPCRLSFLAFLDDLCLCNVASFLSPTDLVLLEETVHSYSFSHEEIARLRNATLPAWREWNAKVSLPISFWNKHNIKLRIYTADYKRFVDSDGTVSLYKFRWKHPDADRIIQKNVNKSRWSWKHPDKILEKNLNKRKCDQETRRQNEEERAIRYDNTGDPVYVRILGREYFNRCRDAHQFQKLKIYDPFYCVTDTILVLEGARNEGNSCLLVLFTLRARSSGKETFNADSQSDTHVRAIYSDPTECDPLDNSTSWSYLNEELHWNEGKQLLEYLRSENKKGERNNNTALLSELVLRVVRSLDTGIRLWTWDSDYEWSLEYCSKRRNLRLVFPNIQSDQKKLDVCLKLDAIHNEFDIKLRAPQDNFRDASFVWPEEEEDNIR